MKNITPDPKTIQKSVSNNNTRVDFKRVIEYDRAGTGVRLYSALIAVFLIMSGFSSGLFSQSIWNADASGGTMDWNTASNWIGGVPHAEKAVIIYSCTTCPQINSASHSKFVQLYANGKLTITGGGSLTVENPGGPGMKTHAGSQVIVDPEGELSIQNFWGEGLAISGSFENGGTININGGHTGIALVEGASFINQDKAKVTIQGEFLNYGLNSSGMVLNNGTLSIDDAKKDGISLYGGVMSNDKTGSLNITNSGVNAIFSKTTFNNKGVLNIDNALNGLYVINGTFNNKVRSQLHISGTNFLNTGIFVGPGTFNNAGELIIKNAQSKGIEISGRSNFNNFNKITLDVAAWAGIFNVGGSNFTNAPCAMIESSAAIVNYANFTNNGIIQSPGGGGTSISINNGTLIGGLRAVSGNATISESEARVWTGCADSNWANPDNWYPRTVSSGFVHSIVQDVAQASGNNPVVSTNSVKQQLTLDSNSKLLISTGASLIAGSYNLSYFPINIKSEASVTIQNGGKLSGEYISLSGTIKNAGEVKITAPFHSVGGFGMSGGTFVNQLDGVFITTIGQYGAGARVGMNNSAVFENSGSVFIRGVGGFSLNRSTIRNHSEGTILVTDPNFSNGQIDNKNSSTILNDGVISLRGRLLNENSRFINNGKLVVSKPSDDGLHSENSTFNNSGEIELVQTNLVQYGGMFNNLGSIDIVAPKGDGIINGGTFKCSGKISVQSSDSHHGILNLNSGNFNSTNGSLISLKKTSNGIINFGHFNNGGTIDIDKTNFARGIESQGTMVNQTSGKIVIKNTVGNGISIFLNSFINDGVIELKDIGGRGLTNSSGAKIENKASGQIYIDNTGDIGFYNFGTTTNSGFIAVSNTPSEDGIATNSSFTNSASGTISITNIGNSGAGFWVINGSFDNSGVLDINGTDLKGFDNWQGHSINHPSGQIHIKNTGWWGLDNLNIFENFGTITIENTGWAGVHNGSWKFDNHKGGSIAINNAYGGAGILTSNGFFNSGSVTISNSLSALLIEASGYLNNHPCAFLSIDGMVDNRNVLNNEGFFKTSFPGLNIGSGHFNNKGILEDFYGSFNGLPLDNHAVWLRPVNGTVGGLIQNVLEIGSSATFQIGTTWYKDQGLNNPAGSYHPGMNTFVPAIGPGGHTLYFTVKDLSLDCTETVAIQLILSEEPIALIRSEKVAEKTNSILFNYPNPFFEKTKLHFTLPFDSIGKLVVFNQLGQQLEVIYEGEMIKGVEYQFDFHPSEKVLSAYYVAALILKRGGSYAISMVKMDIR